MLLGARATTCRRLLSFIGVEAYAADDMPCRRASCHAGRNTTPPDDIADYIRWEARYQKCTADGFFTFCRRLAYHYLARTREAVSRRLILKCHAMPPCGI